MKYLSLAISRIAHYLHKQPVIFIFFFLGITLSSFVFVFFYGNFMPYKVNEAFNQLAYRTFSVVNCPREITMEDLYLPEEYEVQEVIASYHSDIVLTPSLVEIPPEEQTEESLPEYPLTIAAYLYNNERYESEESRAFFTNLFSTEEVNGNNMILSMYYGMVSDVDIGGTSFDVIRGISSMREDLAIIPIDAFFNNALPANEISFILPHMPDRALSSQLERLLQERFPGAELATPSLYDQTNTEETIQNLIILIVIYIISLIAFFLLFKYLLEKNAYENAIYRVVGAKTNAVFRVTFIQITILSMLSSGVSIAFHSIFYESLISKINIYEGITFNPVDYLIVFCATVLISMLASLPFVFSGNKLKIAESKGKHEI